ncbi:MAG: response regulator [Pseudomonadota bacterium]
MSLTILVVDDEPDIRAFLSMLFEDHGYTVHSVENGKLAWQHVQRQRPDLITLDVAMPEQSGVRFFRDMKESESFRDIPIILVTGVDDKFESFISSRRQVPPPEGYHRKPIVREHLLEQVRQLLGA